MTVFFNTAFSPIQAMAMMTIPLIAAMQVVLADLSASIPVSPMSTTDRSTRGRNC
jgi:hypothetical protein